MAEVFLDDLKQSCLRVISVYVYDVVIPNHRVMEMHVAIYENLAVEIFKYAYGFLSSHSLFINLINFSVESL